MKRIAILTDFIMHDDAYSLCSVVKNQEKMISMGGYPCKIIVRPEFEDWVTRQGYPYQKAEIETVNPGEIGSNVVSLSDKTDQEIEELERQLDIALKDCDVVLTHDLIYQPNQWKYHVAAKRIAKKREDIKWLHWVHSATNMNVANQAQKYRDELLEPFPNSRLVVMHSEEFERKGRLYGYQPHQIVIVPNPIDFTENYHPVASEMIEKGNLWEADVIAVYPCRLDRGKQPHILIEIFAYLNARGVDARVVIVDFHSTTGDKADYRNEMKSLAKQRKVPVFFASDLESKDASYHIPHKAVMDLMEFGDILIHPSKSESDPLILPEAMWKRCGLVLNFDLPLFRQYQDKALMYKFSSCIDVHTGMLGETNTQYDDREGYMMNVAGGVAYLMSTNSTLFLHSRMRQTRSLKSVWERHLWPSIEG